MDHISLSSTLTPGPMANFNSASVDCFSNQSSAYPTPQYGHRSPINSQSQLEFNPPPAYNLHYGHSIPQCYQSNMSDGQMTSSYMYQNQPQHHSDNYYPFQTQTPPYFSPGQVAPNQLLQSPASPCHNQTTVNLYQSQSPQFSPQPSHSQNSQNSPRNPHHQIQQIPLVNSPKNKRIQSLQSQQQQPSFLTNGSTQSQKHEQSSKLLTSQQQNSPKDLTCEGQFYANQRISASSSNVHKTQAVISNSGNRMQPSSPAHASNMFQSGAHLGNQLNGDSWPRNLHGGQFGASMNVHNINQSKPSTYICPNSEHHNATVPSNVQHNRYNKNDNTSNNFQRIKRTASLTSSLTQRPQVPGNPNYCPDYNLFSEYNNVASSHLHCLASSKVPPSKSVTDPIAADLTSAQNMNHKSMHPQTVLSSPSMEGRSDINVGNMNRSASGDSIFLERQSHRMGINNQHSLFSVAALNQPSKTGSRRSRNRTNEHATVVQKNLCGNVSPLSWYKCPDATFGSSFQSDIEAMQADVASYASNSGISKMSIKTSQVPHETSVKKSTESHASSQTGFNQKAHLLETQKNGSLTRTGTGQSNANSPKSECHLKSKIAKAEALAAIQIKQEMVDNLNKYKTVSNNLGVNSTSVTKTVNEISSVSAKVTHSVRETNISTVPVAVKDPRGNTYPQSQADTLTRRHSSGEMVPRKSENIKTVQCSEISTRTSVLSQRSSRTPTSVTKTDDHLQRQNFLDNIKNGQHVAIQNKRYTSPCPLDMPLQGTEPLNSSKQGLNVDRQRLSTQRHSLDFPSQSIIHHLFDQVQSLDVQYSNAQQSMIMTDKNILRDCTRTVGSIRQGLKGNPSCTNAFGQVAENNSAVITERDKGNNAAPMINQHQNKNTNLGSNMLKYPPFRIDLPNDVKGTVNEPVVNTISQNDRNHKAAHGAHKAMKMEKLYELNKPGSRICYVMLHGHKLICLKSNSETLLICCQFTRDCFPNKSLESINTCIDKTLHISKKVLDHQDKERIVLFLMKNGYYLGNLETISLEDARQVYHHIYGIMSCEHSSCVVELFHLEVDLDDAIASSPSNISTTKEPKKEKQLADDKSFGQMYPNTGPKDSSFYAGKECYQKRIENTTNKSTAKPINSQISTTMPPVSHSNFGNSGSDHAFSYERDVDCDESDDLILVEASEDPHIIRWSGDALKVGGLCNTIIGQLRSYIHESERYLVVDDLCRVFGSSDFYDGVERENIILHSCCQEIANFLNAITSNFPPLQSLYHSLVKEKDIGIHITDSNFVPVQSSDKNVGSSVLKRPLCKQEIIDDDCSSPKQFRLENNAQVSKSDNQFSIVQPSLVLHQKKLNGETVIDSVLMDMCKTHISDKSITVTEGANKRIPDADNELFKATEENSLPVTVNKFPSQSNEVNNDRATESTLMAVFEVADTRVLDSPNVFSVSAESSVSGIVSSSSSQSFENNNEGKSTSSCITFDSLSQQFLEVSDPETCHWDLPNISVTDTVLNVTDIPNTVNVNVSEDVSIVQSNYSSESNTAESSSLIINELNSPAALLSSRNEKRHQNMCIELEFASHDVQPFKDSLSGNISHISSTPSLHNSMQQPFDSENKYKNHVNDIVGTSNNHLETTVSKQAQPLKSSSPADGCTDLILAQENNEQGKFESNPASNILKSRMEKLKHILETRKNKDLPLPRLLLDTNLNLSLLTNNDNPARDKKFCSDTSNTGTAEGKNINLDHNSVGSESRAEKPIGNDDIISMNNMINSGIPEQRNNNSDLSRLDKLNPKMAANVNTAQNSEVTVSKLPMISECETHVPPQKTTRNILSTFDLDKDTSQPILSPSSRYFPGNRRFMDDTDVASSSIDLLDARPSCYWAAYAKLWQENRALLGVVDVLRKSLALAKADKKKSEDITLL